MLDWRNDVAATSGDQTMMTKEKLTEILIQLGPMSSLFIGAVGGFFIGFIFGALIL